MCCLAPRKEEFIALFVRATEKEPVWVRRLWRRFAHRSLCQALIASGRHGGMICSEVNLFLIAAADILRTWIGCTIAWPLTLRRCHRTEQRERAAGWTRLATTWTAFDTRNMQVSSRFFPRLRIFFGFLRYADHYVLQMQERGRRRRRDGEGEGEWERRLVACLLYTVATGLLPEGFLQTLIPPFCRSAFEVGQ